MRRRKKIYKTSKFKKRFKRKKSILKNRFFRDFILILILVISVFYFLFLSEIFKIREIQISAPEGIPKEEIQALLERELETPFLNFFHRNSFFSVNSKKVEEEILKDYPEIKETNLMKEFPKTLILEVKTREAIGLWCFNEDNCFLIDETGIIFGGPTSENGTEEEGLMVIFSKDGESKNLGEQVIPKEKMNQLFRIQNELEKNLGIDVEKFTLSEGERLDVKTIEGWEIYFDLSSDLNLALTKLSLLLEKEISPEERKNLQYIDLRFSKVYYK